MKMPKQLPAIKRTTDICPVAPANSGVGPSAWPTQNPWLKKILDMTGP